jgi:ABC-type antimicrobial peptide transport system permease subunit
MLRNYFLTAIRNLAKNKVFATLNIFALALGMSISLVFIATVTFFYKYDNFHPNGERIYRVITHVRDNEENPSYASAPAGLAQLLKNDVAGIEKIVRINGELNGNVVRGENEIPLSGYFAEQDFLAMFNFPLVQGDRSSALVKPNSIVITEETAKRIFGPKDPLGELITMKPFGELVVTGVFRKLPANSNMNFEAVASYGTFLSHVGQAAIDREESWKKFTNSYVYMLLAEKASSGQVEQYLSRFADGKYKRSDVRISFSLQRLEDITPGPSLYNQIGPSWSYEDITLVGLITLVILIPACANYVSLAISQSLRRMREIGVRKVMGGLRKQIFIQFVTETTITMMLALVLAYLFFEMIRGEATTYMGDATTLDMSPTPVTFAAFIVFAVIVGFFAGIVPALYFSKIAPIAALKGKEVPVGKRGGFSIRKVVMTVQFMLSLGFIMAVTIALRQYHYSTTYNLGFAQEKILDIELQHVDPQRFRNEFAKLSSIHTLSMSSHVPGAGFDRSYVRFATFQDSLEASTVSIDENFIPNLKLDLLRGNDFSEDQAANARFIIINEEFAKKISPDDPFGAIDQVVRLADGRDVRVGGIVRNFNYDNLRSPIKEFYFDSDARRFRYANAKLQSVTADVNSASYHDEQLEAAWKKIGGEQHFQARLLADEIKSAYEFYFEVVKLWSFLGVLAIFVACIGLLGTVVFTIRTRVKEISLRKVMGASSESLVVLLSKDFVMLMVVAAVITTPVVYFLFDHVLANSQYYRLQIGFFEVVVSISLLFSVGLSSILSQTLKAANTNPVENLRVE